MASGRLVYALIPNHVARNVQQDSKEQLGSGERFKKNHAVIDLVGPTEPNPGQVWFLELEAVPVTPTWSAL